MVVGVIQLASASGNNPPSTTLKYTYSRFTAITPPKRGGAGPGKTVYGDGAWKTTGNMEEGRPDEVGRISSESSVLNFSLLGDLYLH